MDERVGVLTVLLGKAGAKGLEYHLARCLQSRGKPTDLKLAALHAARATGVGAPAASWYLRAELDNQAEGLDAAMRTIYEAIHKLSADDNLVSLFKLGAELLAAADRGDEAIALLKEGINAIPPDKGLYVLYSALGEAHCRLGRQIDAIASIREGIRKVSAKFGQQKLAEYVLLICAGAGDSSKLVEVLGATGEDALPPIGHALGQVLLLQMSEDWRKAAESAKAFRQEFPADMALAGQEAFSLLADCDADGALAALLRFPNFKPGMGGPIDWLLAFIQLRRGDRSEATKSLAAFLDRPVNEDQELNEGFLLRLWDQQENAPDSSRLCFHLPIMPASVTGLSQTVRRLQFGQPVLPFQVSQTPVAPVSTSAVIATSPEIYVSYAWGEDSSGAGRAREEIVDRLCDTVKRSGRVIGRDKDRMRGGDSIERFAHEISKAKRIVAVISEKSLNLEFCMAHELFRAFRRCDYQRAEFQEKVVAVVMDDAKPLLKDNLALVELAKAWQNRMEKLRAELQSVDPTRKSPALWLFVDMMEDMCPRLPDMLGALKDIVMKRGFEEITKDGFQEVITRLPPPATT